MVIYEHELAGAIKDVNSPDLHLVVGKDLRGTLTRVQNDVRQEYCCISDRKFGLRFSVKGFERHHSITRNRNSCSVLTHHKRKR